MPDFGPGDMAIFNSTGKFGNKEDKLFHIHSVRFGTCTNTPKEQYWYSGYLLEISSHESKGLPQIPKFLTTLSNANIESLRAIPHLKVVFK